MPPHQPPRVSRWCLNRASRTLGVPDLPSDADEVYGELAAREGRRAARRWYRTETRVALWRMAVDMLPRARPSIVTGLSLDARLGFRMLRRYPGLTIVGGLAMAFAIFVGAGLFEFIRQTLPASDLPIPRGKQVVGIRLYDRAANVPRLPSQEQFRFLRSSITGVELLSGFASTQVAAQTEGGAIGDFSAARMSPQAFELAGAAPIQGRVFSDADVQAGGEVVVLGFAAWRTLYDKAPAALGQRLKLGDTWMTVIGVMPEGFRFPLSHDLWIPLDERAADTAPLRVMGRMRDSMTLPALQQHLDVLTAGLPLPAADREHTALLAQSYRESWFDTPVTLLRRVIVQQLNMFSALFLALVAANIALLMFARAATRERELVVRSALGAGRRRIVTQFLIEALALFGIATALGLTATGPGLAWVERRIGEMGGGTSPFWFTASVSLDTALYATVLTLVAALIAGGIPAFRATRQLKASRVHETGGGAGRLQLGGIWSAVVVTQVAATVVFTAGTLLMWRQAMLAGSTDAHFPTHEYVAVQAEVDAESGPGVAGARVESLVESIRSLPGVVDVTIASRLPLMTPLTSHVEVDTLTDRLNVAMPQVRPGFFEAFAAPVIDGRSFTEAEAASGAPVVVVDEAFAVQAFGTVRVSGRRLRPAQTDGTQAAPWLEIVGVVRDLAPPRTGRLTLAESPRGSVYQPLSTADLPRQIHFGIHAARADAALLQAVRQTAAATSVGVTVQAVQTLGSVVSAESAFWRLWAELLMIAAGVALLLSLAGIYAVMSFTVTRRTREIGVRMALGAQSGRVTWEVLRGPLAQVLWGVGGGCVIVAGLYYTVTGTIATAELGMLVVFGLVLTAVCGVACLGPSRRALAVQPARALGTNE